MRWPSIIIRSHTLRGGRIVEVPHDDFGTVVKFLAYTGLRWGEMAALKVGSFDMLRRRVNVTEAVAEVKGHLVSDTPRATSGGPCRSQGSWPGPWPP